MRRRLWLLLPFTLGAWFGISQGQAWEWFEPFEFVAEQLALQHGRTIRLCEKALGTLENAGGPAAALVLEDTLDGEVLQLAGIELPFTRRMRWRHLTWDQLGPVRGQTSDSREAALLLASLYRRGFPTVRCDSDRIDDALSEAASLQPSRSPVEGLSPRVRERLTIQREATASLYEKLQTGGSGLSFALPETPDALVLRIDRARKPEADEVRSFRSIRRWKGREILTVHANGRGLRRRTSEMDKRKTERVENLQVPPMELRRLLRTLVRRGLANGSGRSWHPAAWEGMNKLEIHLGPVSDRRGNSIPAFSTVVVERTRWSWQTLGSRECTPDLEEAFALLEETLYPYLEAPPLFLTGFENGDASDWSETVFPLDS